MAFMCLVAGCDQTDNSGDDGDDAVAGCPVTEDLDALLCGTFVDSDEDCEGSGGESGGECNEMTAAHNDTVVACVADAAADGVPFVVDYQYYRNAGQHDTIQSYRVGVNGIAWNTYRGYSDLCMVDETTVQRGVSLETLALCTEWTCIHDELSGAETFDTCENETLCDGV